MFQDEFQRFRDENRDFTNNSADKIEQSHVFLAVFPQNAYEDAGCMIQLGIAIWMDKPIYLLIEKDVQLPRHIARIASGYERVTKPNVQGFHEAMHRLMAKIKKDGFDL
jgi:hypothetical protein